MNYNNENLDKFNLGKYSFNAFPGSAPEIVPPLSDEPLLPGGAPEISTPSTPDEPEMPISPDEAPSHQSPSIPEKKSLISIYTH